jgi:hypothetical protein
MNDESSSHKVGCNYSKVCVGWAALVGHIGIWIDTSTNSKYSL